MRITSQYLLNNFKHDQQKVNQELKKVTEQISSGKKISDNYENPTIYNDTLRLDTHINDLKAVQERTQKGQQFAQMSDDALQGFDDSLRTFKNELLRASNDALNDENRESIAAALEREKAHLITLANTQVEGQFVFAGSATSVRPVDENGTYHGNGDALEMVVGEGVKERYNIDGLSLFMGVDEKVHKTISTNVALKDLESGALLTPDDTLSKLTGDEVNAFSFSIGGSDHDGKAIKRSVTLAASDSMQKLLDEIGSAFGNTPQMQKVDVALSPGGNITVTDKKRGVSALELKLSATQNGNAVKFIDNGYTLAVNDNSDSAYFATRGDRLEGNIALVANGKVADAKTKLSDIAGGVSLSGETFTMKLKNIDGVDKTVSLNLGTNSSFEIDGNSYTIYDAQNNATAADDMTVGQLNDVIAMALANKLPASGSADDYNKAATEAQKMVDVSLSQSGHMQIKAADSTKQGNIAFSFYNDASSTKSFALMSDNAVTTQQAQVDLFSQLDIVIDAVRNGTQGLDAKSGNPRSIGMQQAIAQLDQLGGHVNKNLAKAGVMQKSLQDVQDRSQSMELSLKELKSELTDVDIAEAYMNLNQLSLSYQAILSSVTKINSLTLLNYMK